MRHYRRGPGQDAASSSGIDYVQSVYGYDDGHIYILTGPKFNALALPSGLQTYSVCRLFTSDGTQFAETTTAVSLNSLPADGSHKVGPMPSAKSVTTGAYYVELSLVVRQDSGHNITADRAVYWLSANGGDVLDWDASNFYTTPVSKFADFSTLSKHVCNLSQLQWTVSRTEQSNDSQLVVEVLAPSMVESTCVFFGLHFDAELPSRSEHKGRYGSEILFHDNIITLFPGQSTRLLADLIIADTPTAFANSTVTVCVSAFTEASSTCKSTEL